MAVSLEIRVGNLIAELFAHANVFGYALNFARAIAVFCFEAFFDAADDFLVLVESDFHIYLLYSSSNAPV